MSKLNCLVASAVLSLASTSSQALIVDAYEDQSLGQSWDHSVDFQIQNIGPTSDVVLIDIETFWFPDPLPILKLFETDGNGGTVTLIEHVTITQGPAVTDWHELVWVDDPSGYDPFHPGPVSWSDDGVSNPTGTAVVDNEIGSFEYFFDTPIEAGTDHDYFVLTKTLTYGDGVWAFEIAEIPTSEVPVPAALPLLLSGLAGFVGIGRRRKK